MKNRSRKSAVSTLATTSMFVIALIIGGGTVGMILNAQNQQSTQLTTTTATSSTSSSASNGPYKMTLVITVNNEWNSTISGPRYWVLTPSGLESSANINLPAHTLIQLTIIDYDSASPLPAQFAQVTGTVGNTIYVVNSTTASGDDINTTAASAVSSLDNNTQVGHTFTVPQIGLNIPVASNAIEVADFYINQTGTFLWHCQDPCGYGPSGWLGPMSASGWMAGNLTVS